LIYTVAISLILSGCAAKKVERIEPETTIDLSGRWNDTDSRMVSQAMITDCLNHPWITQHMSASMGKKPSVIVGSMRNKSTEHIAVKTFVNDIERAFINSGQVDVVASAVEREELRTEKDDQRVFASPETIKEMGRELGVDIASVDSAQRAVMGVDVVAVATPSSTPVVMNEWVGSGLHVTSVGVSTAGKQEIATEVFKRGKLVLDELSQTSKIGGINVPFSRGLLRSEDVYAEIGEIILGKKPGRTSDEEVTVFVSSGLAIQDVATAKLVYDKALQQGMGTKVNLV